MPISEPDTLAVLDGMAVGDATDSARPATHFFDGLVDDLVSNIATRLTGKDVLHFAASCKRFADRETKAAELVYNTLVRRLPEPGTEPPREQRPYPPKKQPVKEPAHHFYRISGWLAKAKNKRRVHSTFIDVTGCFSGDVFDLHRILGQCIRDMVPQVTLQFCNSTLFPLLAGRVSECTVSMNALLREYYDAKELEAEDRVEELERRMRKHGFVVEYDPLLKKAIARDCDGVFPAGASGQLDCALHFLRGFRMFEGGAWFIDDEESQYSELRLQIHLRSSRELIAETSAVVLESPYLTDPAINGEDTDCFPFYFRRRRWDTGSSDESSSEDDSSSEEIVGDGADFDVTAHNLWRLAAKLYFDLNADLVGEEPQSYSESEGWDEDEDEEDEDEEDECLGHVEPSPGGLPPSTECLLTSWRPQLSRLDPLLQPPPLCGCARCWPRTGN